MTQGQSISRNVFSCLSLRVPLCNSTSNNLMFFAFKAFHDLNKLNFGLQSQYMGNIVSNFTCFKQRSHCFNIIRGIVCVAGCMENTFTRSSGLCDCPGYNF
ncbi:hypothetical protein DPMN_109395 [Dreissena polymorpha]|uniref:Uncharacterized protein n=1 Tax=Dreissena polymorpha TaxID=45954 RepID=A0A9D4QLX1_DREPO|nr:hypothetical protein DPMN_109395 [Dreissena polymorpha]